MAPDAEQRDPQETIGGCESGALRNRTFEDPDLMAQGEDLELEVEARTKDRTQCDEKCEQGSASRENSESSIIPSGSDLSGFSRGTVAFSRCVLVRHQERLHWKFVSRSDRSERS